jgi:Transposase DNA-binding/Transposase DDE domain
MRQREAVDDVAFVETETSGAEFGDRRLERRLATISAAAVSSPSSSFPSMANDDAALEATYRFLNNDRVTAEAILAPHTRATVRRMSTAGRVVVAHDSTQFAFGMMPRGDLHRVGRGSTYGMYVHFALAVTEDRIPLGLLAMTPFERGFGVPRLPSGRNKQKATNITHRWGEQVCAVRKAVGAAELIHVMDREADDYTLLAELIESSEHFVIRQAVNRRLVVHRAEPKARSVTAATPLIATREVAVSARRKPPRRTHMSRSPLRKARTATLEIRAACVTLPRTRGTEGVDSIAVNLVEVVEKSPPTGQEPIQWWLWTTEPIDTEDDVLAIIDAYRARWTIEEYFKALKTGCRFEQRQLESRKALLNALAIFAPIAWRLLFLRSVARDAPNAPGATALTVLQLRALRGYMRQRLHTELRPNATALEVMLAIAKLGGHITNNGDPGWIVLGRGLDRLLDIELGLSLALKRSDQ